MSAIHVKTRSEKINLVKNIYFGGRTRVGLLELLPIAEGSALGVARLSRPFVAFALRRIARGAAFFEQSTEQSILGHQLRYAVGGRD